MKRREIIKPELNPPYTRLCKEEIKPSQKLYGDDLPKHLKEMTDAKRAGQQVQKSSQSTASYPGLFALSEWPEEAWNRAR